MKDKEKTYVPYRQIPETLKIRKGDCLLLTSDILKLAIAAKKNEHRFDTDALLDSFIEALGPEGTLLIPAYNFDLESGDSYSVHKTLPMTGSLALAALRRNDFVRTANPLHSFLVHGQEAQMLAELKNVSSFGPGSPFAWMMEKNALMLFAGTGLARAMTFTHYVEESLQVSYRRYRNYLISYTDKDGLTTLRKYKLFSKKPGFTMKLHLIEEKLKEKALQTTYINGVPFSQIRCRDAYESISRDIKENKARSISGFSITLYVRDIIKIPLQRFNLFRTTYGKIRSAKRIY